VVDENYLVTRDRTFSREDWAVVLSDLKSKPPTTRSAAYSQVRSHLQSRGLGRGVE
jgi:hypothetical protein